MCVGVYWKGQRDNWDDKGLWKPSEHDDGAGIPKTYSTGLTRTADRLVAPDSKSDSQAVTENQDAFAKTRGNHVQA